MLKVLCNKTLGGFQLSDEAIELFDKRKAKLGQPRIWYWDVQRHDPLLVSIFEELGPRFNRDSVTNVAIELIEAKYENYYTIQNEEGYEKIVIHKDKYDLDRIKKMTAKLHVLKAHSAHTLPFEPER
jgi:hypothetical protein